MKLFCSILLLFSILAGCSPEARQEARKAQLRSYSLKCHKEYGFKFSSDAHRNCKQQLDIYLFREHQNASHSNVQRNNTDDKRNGF